MTCCSGLPGDDRPVTANFDEYRMKTMHTRHMISLLGVMACTGTAYANIVPDLLGPPFAVQPFASVDVTSGMTDMFFSDLSSLSFPGPDIVNLLTGIRAFDSTGASIGSFQITAVTVTQSGSSFAPP